MSEAIRSATIIAAARLVMLMGGLFMALVPMSAQSAESLQEKPTMIKQTIVVEHIRIESAKSFADVRAAIERSVPSLDPGFVKALDDGDVERADREKKEGPELSILQVRNHGAVSKIAGKARNARLRLGQRPGNVARFLVDTARDFSDGNPGRLKQIWTSYFALNFP